MAHRHDKHTTVSASVQNSRGSSVHTQSKSQRRIKSFFTSAVHYYVISGCRRLQLGRSPFHGEHHDGARRARFVEPSLDPRPCQPVHRAEHTSAVRRVFGSWQGSFEGPRAILPKAVSYPQRRPVMEPCQPCAPPWRRGGHATSMQPACNDENWHGSHSMRVARRSPGRTPMAECLRWCVRGAQVHQR